MILQKDYPSGERTYKLIEKLQFERVSGTAGEARAAELICHEIKSMGRACHKEDFELPASTVICSELKSIGETNLRFECTGYEFSASTQPGGIEAELLYVGAFNPDALKLAAGKIVMFDGKLTTRGYKAIIDSGAIGFISYSGRFMDDIENTDLYQCRLKDVQLVMPRIPGVNIRAKDAIELKRGPNKKVRLKLELKDGRCHSRNVVAEIPGTDYPNEVIILMAHYDTVPFSVGAYDNASGSAMLLELFRSFCANPPKRTLRFLWCGSEEIGLAGSKAYVTAHANELHCICLAINFDLFGCVLGEDTAIVMADEALSSYLKDIADEKECHLRVCRAALPSDATRFVDKGIPAVGFGRYGNEQTATMHNRYDTTAFLSAEAIEETMEFVYDFCMRMANSANIPVSRPIPDDVKTMVDTYLCNDILGEYTKQF